MKIYMIRNHMTGEIVSSAGAYPSKEKAEEACYGLALRRAKQAESKYPGKEVVVERDSSEFYKCGDRFKVCVKNGKCTDIVATFRIVEIQFHEEL